MLADVSPDVGCVLAVRALVRFLPPVRQFVLLQTAAAEEPPLAHGALVASLALVHLHAVLPHHANGAGGKRADLKRE